MTARPLDGIQVLDLTRLLPGPFATLMLADLGAQVVKLEDPQGGDYVRYLPPGGPQVSALFAALHRDKRSIAVDLRHAEGREILLRLVSRSDVLVESFRPGVMDRLGLGWSTLHAHHPGLVYCALTGYGQEGPMAHRAGHDLLYLSVTGVAGLTEKEGAPVVPAFQAADLLGASQAVVGILAALLDRSRTGEGRLVDASLADAAAGLGILVQARAHAEGRDPLPDENDLGGTRPAYRFWRCQDGRHVALAALEPKFWLGFCKAIGRPDLAGDLLATGERRVFVEREIGAIFATLPRDAWIQRLGHLDVCVEPVLLPSEAVCHPHAQSRGLFGTHDHPTEGRSFLHHFPCPRLLPGAEPPRDVLPAARLGTHTREVLGALGYDEATLERLATEKVIKV